MIVWIQTVHTPCGIERRPVPVVVVAFDSMWATVEVNGERRSAPVEDLRSINATPDPQQQQQ